MHWRHQHQVSVGSLAGYIWEAMGGPPICHAFTMMGKSFGIPAILFYISRDLHTRRWPIQIWDFRCIRGAWNPFVRLTYWNTWRWNYLLPNCGQTMNWANFGIVDNNHPIRYNNAGLSSAPFPRKLEADHPCVIGHGSDGKHIPAKMARLAERQSLE
jgi:hypothetical protein